MRQAQLFAGSSHPVLADSICEWLGMKPGKAELGKFANGETRVQLYTSIRNQHVFLVQSGSLNMNDSVIELLIMASACKGGSAKSVTAVMPYFPYSRQSKKKSHRGAITARMIANLLHVAGVDHVITIDLHSSQMQGFFKCPIDNLFAEPLLANWIKREVPNWRDGVVMCKNPGGTRRATSLADKLKVRFAIVNTDTRIRGFETGSGKALDLDRQGHIDHVLTPVPSQSKLAIASSSKGPITLDCESTQLSNSVSTLLGNAPVESIPANNSDDYQDEQAQVVTTGIIRAGHLVDEDYKISHQNSLNSPTGALSPRFAPRYRSYNDLDDVNTDTMSSSMLSTVSSARQHDDILGGSKDAAASSEEEEEGFKNPEVTTTVTLIGDVSGKLVFIIDDMIDKAGSWIAAAETAVKRGGATSVICMATHGLFGGNALAELQACEVIESIVVTDSFPISGEQRAASSKLKIVTVAPMLSEAIRRFHHGEPMGNLYTNFIH